MIIFGTRATRMTPFKSGQDCPACQTQEAIIVAPWQRYAHIFWVPVFPTSKGYALVCEQCGATFDPNHINIPAEARRKIKTPKWTYLIFPIIVACLILLGYCGARNNQKTMATYIESPQMGDIYEIETDDNEYSLMKVAEFTPDSIYLYVNQYATNKKSGYRDLYTNHKHDFMEDEIFGYSKVELARKATYNIINKIHR